MSRSTTTPAVLSGTGDIDPAWVEAALSHAGVTTAVRGIERAAVGDGKLSDTTRVTIDYARRPDDAPGSVICKFHSALPAAHDFAVTCGLYRGEFEAYRAVAERSACRIPTPYWAAGGDDWINLVLEDLTATTDPGDQIRGCDLTDARAVIGELAALHAAFFPLDDATAPSWLTRARDAGRVWAPIIEAGAARAQALFADHFDRSCLRLIERAPDAGRRFFDTEFAHLTLTHGDPRVDNVLFDRREGTPTPVLIDWQNAGLRSPMFDVAYFLSGSVTEDDRRAGERDLLDEYVARFGRIALGYAVDAALDDYRVNLISGLLQTLAATAFLTGDGSTGVPAGVDTFLVTLLTRNLAAVRDWQTIEALDGHP